MMRYLIAIALVMILFAGCAKEATVEQQAPAEPAPTPVAAAPAAEPAPEAPAGCTAGYVCKERYRAVYQYENCSFSSPRECNNGCVNTTCESKGCIGTEVGSNISNKGMVMLLVYRNDKVLSNETYEDFCADADNMVEYYCDEGLRKVRYAQCDYMQTCKDGACK